MLTFAAAVPGLAAETDSASAAASVTESTEASAETIENGQLPGEDDAEGVASVNAGDIQEAAETDPEEAETETEESAGYQADVVYEAKTIDLTYYTLENYPVSLDGVDAGSYEWNSSNMDVATVSVDDSTLNITVKSAGTATVTGILKEGSSSDYTDYTISVTVNSDSLYSGIYQDPTGATANYYYYQNGVKTSGSDDANVIQGTVDDVAAWWYVDADGKVDQSYDGFGKNENGWWYLEDGKVTFAKNSVIQDTTGALGTAGTWYYVVKSKVQQNFTGLADYSNENGWWYIKNGKVDFSANTVAKNKNGWYYVTGGKVQFDYTGFGSNSNGCWYCESGKVTFKKNSVIQDTKGVIGSKGIWYYVVGSKVQTSYTGVADYANANGWWYIKNGKVDFSANTVAKNKNGWWYVTGGKVQFG
ncbi:MAG: Ig-like domain-containing protein [Lachnospiraceae bacterium]|nr:Ig-like domain-containing protein [Lachnospiraceae bacterium]